MREEDDFSAARKNHYASLKKRITIRLDEEAIEYFKSISEEDRLWRPADRRR